MKKAELIVALDLETEDEAVAVAEELRPEVDFFKVGLQLFISSGPGIVKRLNELGVRVFLDLKLHDIPNQVANAVTEVSKLDVDFLTLHTLGGRDMMKKAVDARNKAKSKMKLIGVTMLTSMDDNDLESIGIRNLNTTDKMDAYNETSRDIAVSDQADLAIGSGLDGLVSSGLEVRSLRKNFTEAILITPGIRPRDHSDDDQKQCTPPAEAVKSGSDYLVVGRPILKASDLKKAALDIQKEINLANS